VLYANAYANQIPWFNRLSGVSPLMFIGVRTGPSTSVNYKAGIRARPGEAESATNEGKRSMEPLGIARVELDEHELSRTAFNLHLSRVMTAFERETLPQLLSQRFSPSMTRGGAIVGITKTSIAMIEEQKDLLKQIVSEAESQAKANQDAQDSALANAAANRADARRRAAAIDWS
jgi:hypothetical protein